jgi:hypothetical protein
VLQYLAGTAEGGLWLVCGGVHGYKAVWARSAAPTKSVMHSGQPPTCVMKRMEGQPPLNRHPPWILSPAPCADGPHPPHL